MDLITSHVAVDFDGLGSMLAAKALYPGAVLALPGNMAAKVREFVSLHKETVQILQAGDIDPEKVRRLVIVDTASRGRLGPLAAILDRPAVEVHVYDHHPRPEDAIRGRLEVIEEVGACATLLVERLRAAGADVHPLVATTLALGIHSDTGSLTFASATVRDVEALGWLLRQGASQKAIAEYTQRSLNREEQQLLGEMTRSLTVRTIKGLRIAFARASRDEYVPGLGYVTYCLAEMSGADATFALAAMDDRVWIVGRSASEGVDVGSVLREIGGGGHSRAGSASIRGETVAELENRLWSLLEGEVRPAATAASIMSSPVKTVGPDTTIDEAYRVMLRYGHSGLPVVDERGLAGIISRRDVDKARQHGLGHAPVKGYMARQLLTVSPSATVEEMERLMVEHDKGRLPVLDGGQLVGIVTRTDVLRTLYGDANPRWHRPTYRRDGEEKNGVEKDENILERELPARVREILDAAGRAGEGAGCPVYAVGGIVRDLLLGVPNYDLDLSVVGDGGKVATELGLLLGGEVRLHPEFGTATVNLPDGWRVDVATARREFYEYAAALPVVEFGSLRDDLYRRDFTINAMAVPLNGPGRGRLLDFYGGQRDLNDGLVRVLHSLSFIEDPTRLFRAVRFEQRYGLRIEADTADLAREAVASGVLGQLSRDRVRDELATCLGEERAPAIIPRLAELGILGAILPGWRFSPRLTEYVERVPAVVAEVVASTGRRLDRWLVYLLVLLHTLGRDWRPGADLLHLARRDGLVAAQALEHWDEVLRALDARGELRNSTIYRLLRGWSPEGLAFLLARAGSQRARERIRLFMTALASTRLAISGHDLRRLGFRPGPLFRGALETVLFAKLDGQVQGPEEERRLAVTYIEGRMGGDGRSC